jgi:hypothetical protein
MVRPLLLPLLLPLLHPRLVSVRAILAYMIETDQDLAGAKKRKRSSTAMKQENTSEDNDADEEDAQAEPFKAVDGVYSSARYH